MRRPRSCMKATDGLIRALSGKRTRGRTARSGDPKPHGVLVEATEAAEPMLADLISNVVSNLLPVLAGELWERRAAGAALTNTDGHRLALITGLVQVDEPAAAAERLAAHEDFRTEEDGELNLVGARALRDGAADRARDGARRGRRGCGRVRPDARAGSGGG